MCIVLLMRQFNIINAISDKEFLVFCIISNQPKYTESKNNYGDTLQTERNIF